MENEVIGRMRDTFAEGMRDMGLPEEDIPGRLCRLMREVHGLTDQASGMSDCEDER